VQDLPHARFCESRLLEWRKRAPGCTEEMIVYAPLRTEAPEEGAEPQNRNQTRFLLGLRTIVRAPKKIRIPI
jgi:hypothetical protein